MACYYIVVYSKQMLTYSMICNLRMACYVITVDSKGTVDLLSDL